MNPKKKEYEQKFYEECEHTPFTETKHKCLRCRECTPSQYFFCKYFLIGFEQGKLEQAQADREMFDKRQKQEIEFLKCLLNEKKLIAETYLGKFVKARIVRLEYELKTLLKNSEAKEK